MDWVDRTFNFIIPFILMSLMSFFLVLVPVAYLCGSTGFLSLWLLEGILLWVWGWVLFPGNMGLNGRRIMYD
jgi:hypothetical protein